VFLGLFYICIFVSMKNKKFIVRLDSEEITIDGGFVCDVTGEATHSQLVNAFIEIQDPFVQPAIKRNKHLIKLTEVTAYC
jgi:hypothetical protein